MCLVVLYLANSTVETENCFCSFLSSPLLDLIVIQQLLGKSLLWLFMTGIELCVILRGVRYHMLDNILLSNLDSM